MFGMAQYHNIPMQKGWPRLVRFAVISDLRQLPLQLVPVVVEFAVLL